METFRKLIGRPYRPPRLDRRALAALLVVALAPAIAEAGPLRVRARAIAERVAAQRALLGADAGTTLARQAAAQDGAVRLRQASILDSEAFRRQEAFYAQALQAGMTRVPRPQFLDLLLVPDASGLLPESATIDYLRFRRGLNQARFDRVHPFIGPILERDRIVRTQVPIPLPPVVPEIPTIPPVTPQIPEGPILGGGKPSPQVPVPEPSTLAVWVALGLGGAFALQRRRASA
ncbi:PEP-CTERM sorting domain-containing protein [Tautonia plasticadhaerens]|uniref:Uncharacterized protein n=1 Tax=Tautonia plasticadhaerens TaxID=2527974 RepID=A0A518HAV4_9BACT|nr:PEP-CTERM sorting domain-containing protein [Tautonia plasticadhaerens]QDV37992.1 hypothetical protein ElP_59390 [Tautonia plasticadhaerens]